MLVYIIVAHMKRERDQERANSATTECCRLANDKIWLLLDWTQIGSLHG